MRLLTSINVALLTSNERLNYHISIVNHGPCRGVLMDLQSFCAAQERQMRSVRQSLEMLGPLDWRIRVKHHAVADGWVGWFRLVWLVSLTICDQQLFGGWYCWTSWRRQAARNFNCFLSYPFSGEWLCPWSPASRSLLNHDPSGVIAHIWKPTKCSLSFGGR